MSRLLLHACPPAVRALACCLLLACCATAMHAQSVSPAVVQYASAAEGSFLVTNDGLSPVVVTIDARSFTIDTEGNSVFTPLDPGIHLDLSQTSLRVPPHQQRTIYYKASADHYPAWFSVYANFSGLPRRNGFNVQLSLPHTVYLLGRQTIAAADLHFNRLQVKDGHLQGVLRNSGSAFARVQQVELLTHGKGRTTAGGFPLLPGGERTFTLDLPREAPASTVRVHLEKLTVEQALP